MTKLIATYTEGFLGVFTESRDGMQQRALIDVGQTVMAPKDLANLANVLDNQFNWSNNIVKGGPKSKAIDGPKRGRGVPSPDDPPLSERKRMVIDYLSTHPESLARDIITGCGFEDTASRVNRWAQMLATMKGLGILTIVKRHGNHPSNPSVHEWNVYSLAEGS